MIRLKSIEKKKIKEIIKRILLVIGQILGYLSIAIGVAMMILIFTQLANNI